ncbi:helix-turn-helix domain-containing protein [Eubacterium sp. MSJ-13]|uniref:helix-turn-helix domain-containing protein n=1 Tax=Eubacterium sp. MSJ-13 TaxID=2841513 RepID=UPI001C0F5C05|nr:helix-turn-helix transcriptional regulator [Eubacterium sp. MSJ-13]MBU5478194.1 helix-turn-helix domain-containing protein [Eubacterium sp. MSJ-13]
MKNPVIAKMLKYYRKANNLTVDDVASYLEKCGVSVATKTIYGWESGQTQPDADILLSLCKFYRITDILGTFGYSKNKKMETMTYSLKERDIIDAYRKNPDMQAAVDKLLDIGR